MPKGKLIIIEGVDGSGKGTQVKLLVDRLTKEGKSVEMADFPQYGNFSAAFVEKYLRGEYGPTSEIGPYKGSLFYALDRFDKSFDIRRWLDEGKVVICNRYATANMGHQAGKIKNLAERDKLLDWLEELEYGILGLPRPDLVILLFVPPEIAQELVDKKDDRAYTRGQKRDGHEGDLNHLRDAADAYQYVAAKYGWKTVECAPDGKLLPIEDVHSLVYDSVKDMVETQ